ncbi:unnamed protein product [Closterium sp. NIES-64]|nr:unnamed protein product [Closterium sp. NIES-64]
MGNPTHLTYGSLIPPTTNPLRVAQPSTSLARPTPSPLFPPSAVIAPSSPADPTAASASQPPRRRDTPSLPPPPLFFFPPPRLLWRRLRIPPRRLVAASSSPCRDPPSPSPSRRCTYFGVARASLRRNTPSSPAPPAAATSRRRLPLPPPRLPRRRLRIPSSRRPVVASRPAAATSRRRLCSPSPRLRVAAYASRCRDLLVAACTTRRRDFASPPARPAAATSRRRLSISPPQPSRRRLHPLPPRPKVAALATFCRDLLVAARTSRRRDLKIAPPPASYPRDLLVAARVSRRRAFLVAARASRHRALPVAARSFCRHDSLVATRASRRRAFLVAAASSLSSSVIGSNTTAAAAAAAASGAAAAAAASTIFLPLLPQQQQQRQQPPRVHPPSPLMATTPPPLPPPIDASSVDKLQLAADRSAINWHSFVGSIRRVLQDAFVGPYCVIDVLLRRPQALQPTAPNHPGEPPPPPIPPGPPPTEPTLEIATTLALQDAADAAFLHDRREYLIRKAEHEVAVHNHDFAVAERANRLALLDEYNTAMADYLPRSIAWATADNRACTVLLGALPGTLMRRFQAREMRASLTWAELQAMFERRDISSVGALFQEYFSITLATCDGAVDYVGRMQVVADRLAARQAALPEPLQIHRLLYNLTPDYESRLHAFTEANPMASLDDVVQWIIDTEVKLRTPVVNLTTPQSSSSTSLNATQPRNQGAPLLEDFPVLVVL